MALSRPRPGFEPPWGHNVTCVRTFPLMNVAGVINIAEELGPEKIVGAIACDTGLKHLSEGLFSQ